MLQLIFVGTVIVIPFMLSFKAGKELIFLKPGLVDHAVKNANS